MQSSREENGDRARSQSIISEEDNFDVTADQSKPSPGDKGSQADNSLSRTSERSDDVEEGRNSFSGSLSDRYPSSRRPYSPESQAVDDDEEQGSFSGSYSGREQQVIDAEHGSPESQSGFDGDGDGEVLAASVCCPSVFGNRNFLLEDMLLRRGLDPLILT